LSGAGLSRPLDGLAPHPEREHDRQAVTPPARSSTGFEREMAPGAGLDWVELHPHSSE
jgi:hypothetical protein